MKEQASTATSISHPLFMAPFTPEELKHAIKKLLPDKSPGPSGITNRMRQDGEIQFQGLILIFFNGLWKFHTQPSDWQRSLLQPIYKGHNKDKTDPASYRGIYLNDTLAKLFEGLLIARLTTHTELPNTLTDSQLGTKPDTQTHDAIYSLFTIIQQNKYALDKPTYVAFVDYSTAYPSVHRDGLSSTLLKNDIRGNMWYHFRARFDKLSSEFSTLAFPHATQSTSSENCLKGVVLVRHFLEYLLLILFTNSEPNFLSQISCGYLPWTALAQPTHPQSIHYTHLDWRTTLC